MSKLGMLGALDGLGKGVSEYGAQKQSFIRDQWLQQANRDERAADRKADQDFQVQRDATKHKNDLELQAAKPGTTGSGSVGDDYKTWTNEGVSYRMDRQSRTWKLDSDSNRWEQVYSPDNPSPFGEFNSREELEAAAEEHADRVVNDKAGAFRLDTTDFAEYEGSRTKAREAFKNEFINNNGVVGTGASRSVSLDEPPQGSPPSTPQASSQLPDLSKLNLAPQKLQIATDAQRAITERKPRERIIEILKQQGFTDEEIRQTLG